MEYSKFPLVFSIFIYIMELGDSMKLYVLDITDIEEKEIKTIRLKGSSDKIHITRQKTGFGYKRFLICPNCGERRTKLYSYNQIDMYCRACIPGGMYKGITHTTKGGTLNIHYRMNRIAEKYNIKFKVPFSYYQLLLERPKYMRYDKWEEGARKLQILENMRFQTIFFQKKYDSNLIKYVLENCLYIYELWEIDKYILNWEEIAFIHKKWAQRLLSSISTNFVQKQGIKTFRTP